MKTKADEKALALLDECYKQLVMDRRHRALCNKIKDFLEADNTGELVPHQDMAQALARYCKDSGYYTRADFNAGLEKFASGQFVGSGILAAYEQVGLVTQETGTYTFTYKGEAYLKAHRREEAVKQLKWSKKK